MRWPIRLQLRLATFAIVITAVVLASAAGTWLAIASAARTKAEELDRIQRTLAQASFPLTENVLRQMAGLSGAEFVLVDSERRPLHSTVALDDADLAILDAVPLASTLESLPETSLVRLAGRDYFASLVKVARSSAASPDQSLIVLYGKDQWWAVARQVAAPIVGAGLVAILLAVGLASALAGRLVRPIEALKAQAERIASGRFEPVAVSARNDELADLAAAINHMTVRLNQYEDEVRRSEQLRTLTQLGAGMAHTLRNAATGARLAIELHQRKHPDLAEKDSLKTALAQLERIESYVRRFLRHGRPAVNGSATVVLNDLVEEVVQMVRPAFEHSRIGLETRLPSVEIRVAGDAPSLREMTLNLVVNAMEAAGSGAAQGAAVTIDLDGTDPREAVLVVTDSGPGPDPDVGARLFEPFVSEKPEGTGLGLYLARQTVRAHGGSIRWDRSEGTTRFLVSLPVAVES